MPALVFLSFIPLFLLGYFFIPPVRRLLIVLRNKREEQSDVKTADLQKVESLKERAFAVIADSLKKAQNILVEAEIAGIKMTADSRVKTARFEKFYEDQWRVFLDRSREEFRLHATDSREQFNSFLEQLKRDSEMFERDLAEKTQLKLDDLLKRVEDRLTYFLVQMEKKSVSAVDEEIAGARELIDNYKREQMAVIDENIIAMLEKTLSLVLSKKLTLKDQIELVYEALNKAKLEKFML